MKPWDEIAAKEGRIYCQTKDTWCAMVNMANGECTRKICVQDDTGLKKEETNNHDKQCFNNGQHQNYEPWHDRG